MLNILKIFIISILCNLLVLLNGISFPKINQKKNKATHLKPITNAKSFNELFEKQREISLDMGEKVIGIIVKIKVGPNGQFLLLDIRFGDAFLVDHSGKLIKDLNIENELPGYRWHPQTACFSSTGEILVWCGSHDILLFDKKGIFKKKIKSKVLRYYRDFVVDNENHIFSYAIEQNKFFILKMDFNGKVLRKGGKFPEEYHDFMYRFDESGCIELDQKGFIYQTNISSPEIYKYSKDIKLVNVFKRKPLFFKQLPKDMNQLFWEPMRRFNEIKKIMKEITQNTDLFALNDSLYLSQYYVPDGQGHDKNKFALDIWSTRGNYYSSDNLRYKLPIRAAYKNFVYVVYQPEMDAKGNVPNPIIVEYKLRFK